MKTLKVIIGFAILILTGVLGIYLARTLNTAVALMDPDLLVISFPATIIFGAFALMGVVKLLNKIRLF